MIVKIVTLNEQCILIALALHSLVSTQAEQSHDNPCLVFFSSPLRVSQSKMLSAFSQMHHLIKSSIILKGDKMHDLTHTQISVCGSETLCA